jgi:hypothetical protein
MVRRPSPQPGGRRLHGSPQPIDALGRCGGVVSDGTTTRIRATGETLLVPTRKGGNWASRITGTTGKSAVDERVAGGVEAFLLQIRDELAAHTYRPMRNRRQEIPKDGGKVRVLGIPCLRDRVVQGALKLILEPIFEADFQPGSFGYRPGRTAHEAVQRVAEAIVKCKTRIIDVDWRAYFDNVQHDLLLAKVAARGSDPDVLHLLKMILKASGKKVVPQGGVISPLLRDDFRRCQSQQVGQVVALINPILSGWVNYFAVGHSSRCFGDVKDWVEKKVRRHTMRARKRRGFGWHRWSRRWLYENLGLFDGYQVRQAPKALPTG